MFVHVAFCFILNASIQVVYCIISQFYSDEVLTTVLLWAQTLGHRASYSSLVLAISDGKIKKYYYFGSKSPTHKTAKLAHRGLVT